VLQNQTKSRLDRLQAKLKRDKGQETVIKTVCSCCFNLCGRAGYEKEVIPFLFANRSHCELCLARFKERLREKQSELAVKPICTHCMILCRRVGYEERVFPLLFKDRFSCELCHGHERWHNAGAYGRVLFHGTEPPPMDIIENQAAEQTTLF